MGGTGDTLLADHRGWVRNADHISLRQRASFVEDVRMQIAVLGGGNGSLAPGVIEPCEDALSAALMNAGPIIHPPMIVMNAAPLEHFSRWDIHEEGTQSVVRRVTDALDAERIAIRVALDYCAPHFPLANHYACEGEEWMYGRGSHDKLTDSGVGAKRSC